MCLFNIFQGKYLINQFFLKVINRFVFEQLHVNKYFCLFYRLWEELVLPVSFSVHRKNYSSCLPSDITDARPSLGAEVSILRLTSNIFLQTRISYNIKLSAKIKNLKSFQEGQISIKVMPCFQQFNLSISKTYLSYTVYYIELSNIRNEAIF